MTASEKPAKGTGAVLIGVGAVVLVIAAVVLLRAWNDGRLLRAQFREMPVEPVATQELLAEKSTVELTRPPLATASPASSPSSTAQAEPAASTAMPVPSELPAPSAAVVMPAGVTAPVRLVIADLGIDVPVVEMGWQVVEASGGPVSEWLIPENEAGHHVNSARMGQAGNLVVSGHNNIYGKVFEPISQAWDNDRREQVDAYSDRSDVLLGRAVEVYGADGRRVDYKIEEFYRLKDTGVPLEQRLANARFMQPTDDTRLTLVTCWPPWNNTHRLIVIARPASAS